MTFDKPDPPPLYFNHEPDRFDVHLPAPLKFAMWFVLVLLAVILVVI